MRDLVLWVGVSLLVGCSDGDPLGAPRVVSVEFAGRRVSPTVTLEVLLSAPLALPSVEGNVLLARGEPDAALERPPPPPREQERLVPIRIEADGARLRVTPRRALDPRTRYTLVLGPKLVAGGARLGRPVALAVETGEQSEAAPIVELVAPLDGAVDVPRNLRAVALRFSRPVSSPLSVSLVDDDGGVVLAHASPAMPEGVRLDLDRVLDSGRHYELRAGPEIVDEIGRAVFGDPPGFMAGMDVRSGAPVLHAFEASSSDRCVVVRFATDEPTWSQTCVGQRCVADDQTREHEAAIAFGDSLDGGPLALDARAWDETTRPTAETQAEVAAPSVLPLALTEILTRPRGPRPAQQFVELFNPGARAIALDGLSLHTGSGSNALPAGTLAGGAWAVVVPSGYVAGAGGDPAPAAGTLVLRVDEGRLGGHGIHVAGEPVWIEDAAGRVVTRWGGYPLPVATGQSIARASGAACDVAANFAPTASGGSTPGGP